jgi:hypothetical protein
MADDSAGSAGAGGVTVYGGGCICGKAHEGRMLVADGTCLWCGRGTCRTPPRAGRSPRLRRLPRDLGALQREGRRPDPHLDNVVRLDRLREAWKMPPAPAFTDADLALLDPVCACGCGTPLGGHANRRYATSLCAKRAAAARRLEAERRDAA